MKKQLIIIFLVLAAIAWLMPLIYKPATPYAWALLGLYTVAAVVKAFANTSKDRR